MTKLSVETLILLRSIYIHMYLYKYIQENSTDTFTLPLRKARLVAIKTELAPTNNICGGKRSLHRNIDGKATNRRQNNVGTHGNWSLS
jgi:hypothetical protein